MQTGGVTGVGMHGKRFGRMHGSRMRGGSERSEGERKEERDGGREGLV